MFGKCLENTYQTPTIHLPDSYLPFCDSYLYSPFLFRLLTIYYLVSYLVCSLGKCNGKCQVSVG